MNKLAAKNKWKKWKYVIIGILVLLIAMVTTLIVVFVKNQNNKPNKNLQTIQIEAFMSSDDKQPFLDVKYPVTTTKESLGDVIASDKQNFIIKKFASLGRFVNGIFNPKTNSFVSQNKTNYWELKNGKTNKDFSTGVDLINANNYSLIYFVFSPFSKNSNLQSKYFWYNAICRL